jgi:hypothetical protein
LRDTHSRQMGQDFLKQCWHDDKARYGYSRLTVHKGVSCDRNVMEYSNEEYCGMHGNSHYLIQFDAIQVLKFCENHNKVYLRYAMPLMCQCTSSGSCTDTKYHRFSNCDENREEISREIARECRISQLLILNEQLCPQGFSCNAHLFPDDRPLNLFSVSLRDVCSLAS